MSNERRGMILMVACALFWSLSGVFIKLIPWDPFVINAGRSLFTGLVLFGYMRLKGMKLRFNKNTIRIGICVSMIYACYLNAVKLTSAANAIVLQYTAPVYVLIFSAILYKQKIKRGDTLAVVLTMAGIALFFFDQLGDGLLIGNILALVSGVFLAGQFILAGRADEETRFGGLMVAQILTLLISAPFAFTSEITITLPSMLYIVLLGVVQLGLPYILYVKAMRHCNALTCSLIAVLEPMLNPVWVFLVVGETPSIFALIGAVIVLITITVWCITGERIKQKATLAVLAAPPPSAALSDAEPSNMEQAGGGNE